jgi:hypothetical protein
VAYTVAASAGGKNLKLTDFLLRFGGRRRQSGSEVLNVFRALAARMSPPKE